MPQPLHIRHLAAALSVTAAMACGLTGCYSPTHTAPISGADLKREGVAAPSPEQQLVGGVRPAPPRSWCAGKTWRITDDRLRLMLRGDIPADTLAGKTLTLTAISAAPTITGDSVVELRLSVDGHDVAYRTSRGPAAFMARSEFALPFAVETAPVAELDSLLRGRSLYVLTSTWLDGSGNYIKGRRYVPVTVTAVTPGEPQSPARVTFSPAYDPSVTATLAMTLTPGAAGQRDFPALFSLSDPRRSNSDIYPDVWDLITRGTVAEGMTRRECRLALGNPASVDRREFYGFTRETWSYGNGTYLTFDDGILKTFRL